MRSFVGSTLAAVSGGRLAYVYIDTSAYKPSRYPPELVDYLRSGGRKKVLFGTNYPMLLPAACVAELESLQLDDEAARLFLHDNAVKVFKLQ